MDGFVAKANILADIDDTIIFTSEHWERLLASDRVPEWIEQLRVAESSTRKLRLRLQASLDGTESKCAYCGKAIYARADARYCSPSHRVMGNR